MYVLHMYILPFAHSNVYASALTMLFILLVFMMCTLQVSGYPRAEVLTTITGDEC